MKVVERLVSSKQYGGLMHQRHDVANWLKDFHNKRKSAQNLFEVLF